MHTLAQSEAAAAPPAPPGPAARAWSWRPTALVLAPFAAVAAVRAGWLTEGDTFWQVRTGAEILRRHTVFLPDTFSWTVPGRTWHPNSWLYDVLLDLAWRAGGRFGLAAFTFVTVLLVGAATVIAARALGARPGPTAVAATLLVLPMVLWLSTRPQTLTYLLLPLVLLLAERTLWWRGRRLAGGLLGLYLLSALWINLHLAALGVLPALGVGLAALLAAHRARWRRLVPAGAAVLAAIVLGCASSPFGFGAVVSALATRDASTAMIVEWAPLWRSAPLPALTWAGAAVAVTLAGLAWRRRPADRHLPVWVGASAALLLLGVDAARFSPMSLVVALPVAGLWAGGLDWSRTGIRRRVAWLAPRVAIGWCAALLTIAVLRVPDLGLPEANSYPSAATVAAIPAGCRVLDEYDDGGLLILMRGDDGVRVAVDGRNDVYGETVLRHVDRLVAGADGALAELARDDVRCLLLDPDRPVLAQARAAGWREAARDANRVLLVAPGG